MSLKTKTIVGIDPGSKKTGYAVLQSRGQKVDYLTSGFIALQSQSLAERLKKIFIEIQKLLQQYQPTVVAIEKIFYSINAQSSLTLAHTRGVILLCCSLQETEIQEYTAREIKRAATGYGNASKEQIQKTMALFFRVQKVFSLDEADALATALCCAHHSPYVK